MKLLAPVLGLLLVPVLLIAILFGGAVGPDQEAADAADAACPGTPGTSDAVIVQASAAPEGAADGPDSAGSRDDTASAGANGATFELPGPGSPVQNYAKTKAMPIPADMKDLYVAAGKRFGVPWELVAGIGMEETHHNRIKATSSAGAQGAMQHMPQYFPAYAQDGDGDGKKDITNKADSVHTTAYRLSIEGARKDAAGVRAALFSYNRAQWYINDVLSYARDYAQGKVTVTAASSDEATAQCAAQTGDGMDCPPSGLGAEKGLKPNALRVVRCVHQQFPKFTSVGGVGDRPANSKSDHPNGRAVDFMTTPIDKNIHSAKAVDAGWEVAHWVEKNAPKLGVTYVIFYDKIWQASGGGWQPYTHPSGATDDTSAHRDHVHVSVAAGDVGSSNASNAAQMVKVSGDFTNPIHAKYRKSSPYGMRLHPIQKVWKMHDGLDMAAPEETPIYSGCTGKVTEVKSGWGTGGNMTRVDCGGGISMRYLHQVRHATTVGASVKAGQLIGYVGHTGGSKGDHLHFTVLVNNQTVEPVQWMAQQGVNI